ncbi:uncharacterized protein PHALS_12998 [Plasmopara halstedii]|uniref:Uncharacterized protein n=1 Tax=Plasmopara halstedii TaxID=4781 RepID=A0A0P1AND7_PLAHL|nr:uncharacterized protein PHALS_12998 [Plasmopara halstedii]CEG42748.1 hypothetical protein PHALS_12998 [Plasmopara halstedii]|eukprot:XP_024579117.1 hypothetical protein PHALS_12998 [Plasmopara halstedii]
MDLPPRSVVESALSKNSDPSINIGKESRISQICCIAYGLIYLYPYTALQANPRQVVATKIPSAIALAFVFVLAVFGHNRRLRSARMCLSFKSTQKYRSRVHAHGSVCNSHKGVIAYDQILICALPKNPITRV